jgi:hypothetical protein
LQSGIFISFAFSNLLGLINWYCQSLKIEPWELIHSKYTPHLSIRHSVFVLSFLCLSVKIPRTPGSPFFVLRIKWVRICKLSSTYGMLVSLSSNLWGGRSDWKGLDASISLFTSTTYPLTLQMQYFCLLNPGFAFSNNVW